MSTAGTDHAQAIRFDRGLKRILLDDVTDPVHETEIAVTGINMHLVGLWVFLEQRLLALGQFARVLRQVLRRDGEQRFFGGVRTRLVPIGLGHTRPGLVPLAGVLGDTRRRTRLLGAHAGEFGSIQFRSFIGRHLGQHDIASCSKTDGQHGQR